MSSSCTRSRPAPPTAPTASMSQSSPASRMAKRIITLATIAFAASVALSPAGAGPPSHTVRIGFLENIAPTFDPATNPAQREFVEGLRELGYAPGHNVVLEFKSAQGDLAM